jgi:RimJ/RimL family protein N-acetyltransferase
MMEQYKDIEILTDRLVIRVPRIEDAEEINAAMNEVWNELQLWMSWAYDDQRTLAATRSYLTEYAQKGLLPLAGFCRESNRFAVATGINFREDGGGETGYWVACAFLGKGYATEATIATMHHGFNVMRLGHFVINHYEGNDKSRRIIEKLGFTKTGVAEKSHARCLDGVLLDEHQYIMTKERWRERCP